MWPRVCTSSVIFSCCRPLPSMKEWYAAALKELWRHADYEKAVHQVGTLVADYRG